MEGQNICLIFYIFNLSLKSKLRKKETFIFTYHELLKTLTYVTQLI